MRASIGVGCLWLGLTAAACKSPPTQQPRPAPQDPGPAPAQTPSPTPANPDAGPGPADAPTVNPTCFPRGAENTAATCGNRLDDDCDGQIDCADNECVQAPGNPCRAADVPAEAPPGTGACVPQGAENTAAACGNRADDDCDGQTDCADNGCLLAPRTPCGANATGRRGDCVPQGPENTLAFCGNRLDDDCDGQSDCADNDCLLAPNTPCGADAAGRRGDCVPRGTENTAAACGNRLDDDCDGLSDCDDNDCTPIPAAGCGRRDAQVQAPPAAAPGGARPVRP